VISESVAAALAPGRDRAVLNTQANFPGYPVEVSVENRVVAGSRNEGLANS
jgi:hypothetical protein